jgi:hypothetical protein
MSESELIKVLLAEELRGLCINCTKFETCSYRKNSTKIVIQCELYELTEQGQTADLHEPLKGLCVNCCNADACRLPDKLFGVWHCEAYG